MNNALSLAYPSDRTLPGQIFRPVVDPHTYMRVLHLFLMFPLGIAYFVFLVVTFAVGGSLIWTFPGAAILLASVFVSRYVGDIESRAVSVVTGVEIRRPPWRLEGIDGWRGRLWARFIDPTTWTGLVYLIAQFPIGIAAFVSLITIFSVAGALVATPFIVLFSDETVDILQSDRLKIVLDSPLEALWTIPLGLLIFVGALHLVTAFSALHATWARLLLGSRTKQSHSIGPSPLPDPPGGLPGEPEPGLPAVAVESQKPESVVQVRPVLAPVRQFTAESRGKPVAKPPPGPLSTAQARLNNLTQREREVVLLVAEGMTNAEIAESCFISQGTVKTHVKRILAKLELRDRAQVVVYAYETGTVVPKTANRMQSTAGL